MMLLSYPRPKTLFLCLVFLCVDTAGFSQHISKKDSIAIVTLLDSGHNSIQTDAAQALKKLELAIKLSGQKHFDRGLYRGYHSLSLLYSIQSDPDKSLAYEKKSVAIMRKHKEFEGQLYIALNGLANCYFNLSDYDLSFKAGSEALVLAEKYKDSMWIAASYGILSQSYYYQENKMDRALIYANKALEINKKTGGPLLSGAYLQCAEINMELREFNLAFDQLLMAEKTNESEDFYHLGMIYNQLGACSFFLNRYGPAETYFEKSLAISKQYDMPNLSLISYVYLGRLYTRKKDFNLAEKYLTMGLQIAKGYGTVTDFQDVYRRMSELYFAKQDFEKAFTNQQLSLVYADSVLDAEKARAVEEMSARFQTRQMSDKNKLLVQQNTLQKLKSQENSIILYSVIILVLSGTAFLYYYFRQKNIISNNRNKGLQQKLLLTQMNPHFIFNSVDNIQSLIYAKQDDEAIVYLSKFSKLTRQILENSTQDYIPFDEELVMIDNYMAIQKLLYSNKFIYSITIDRAIDPKAILVPPMLTQPFIENAVKHGLRNKQHGGEITINYYMEGGRLYFKVTDNGTGIAECDTKKTHTSLSTQITKDRLDSIAKAKIDIHTNNSTDGSNSIIGFTTYFELPFVANE